MSKIINQKMKGRTLITSFGEFKFDKDGVVEILDDKVVKALTSLAGYSVAAKLQDTEETTEVGKDIPVENNLDTKEKDEIEDAGESENDSVSEDELSKMNVPQLKKYAKDNGIDLGDASKKDEILEVILSK